jgi:hypothetical protein
MARHHLGNHSPHLPRPKLNPRRNQFSAKRAPPTPSSIAQPAPSPFWSAAALPPLFRKPPATETHPARSARSWDRLSACLHPTSVGCALLSIHPRSLQREAPPRIPTQRKPSPVGAE